MLVRVSRYLLSLLAATLVTAATTQQGHLITSRGIGAVRFCEGLRRVNALFPTARDTIMTGEGDDGWPSKIVSLGNGEWITFESSWVDTTHIWRVTTNSPKYHTPGGARVGMSIDDLLRRHQKLEFSYPEGYVVITISRDSVSFLVDDHSATVFWSRFDYRDSLNALNIMSHEARIKQLFAGADCRH